MSSATSTFKALLATVSSTANTMTDTVNTLGAGVGMVNTFVQSAAEDQQDRQKIHRATYRTTLITETSIDMARQSKEVAEFMSSDEEAAGFYLQHEADLKKLFA